MTMFKSDKEKREGKNDLAYESLKIALANCPNLAFNKYVLSLAKTFIKKGQMKKQKSDGIYTLFLYNCEYNGKIEIKTKNKNKEIIISISPILKNATLNMTKKVAFNNGNIIMLDITKYEENNSTLLESTSCSIFRNNCPINSLGDDYLVYLETLDTQLENGNKKESTGLIRIKNNGLSLGEIWNSEEQKKIYFKDKGIFVTFEDILNDGFLPLEKAELSDEIIDEDNKFISEWLKENYETKETQKKII